MSVFKLLGSILDRIAFHEGSDCSSWSEVDDMTAKTFVVFDMSPNNEDIKAEAIKLLDIDDSISNQDYDDITFVFDEFEYCLMEVKFGKESHMVYEYVNNFVDLYNSMDIYHKMCYNIINLKW